MYLFKQKFDIAIKSTLPTYIIITIITLFFLKSEESMISLSRFGTTFGAKILFSLAFNLLYLIPQFTGLFIGLQALKPSKGKMNAKWFMRLPTPITVFMTFTMILMYYILDFFPANTNQEKLYITFILITILNISFTIILTFNIYNSFVNKLELSKIHKGTKTKNYNPHHKTKHFKAINNKIKSDKNEARRNKK